MAVTGKGAYPLRSTWGRGRGRGTSNLYRPVYLVSNNDEKEVIWTDWFFEGVAGSDTVLSVADVALSLTVQAPTLFTDIPLTIADVSFSTTADSPTLSLQSFLQVQDVSLGVTVDSPVLTTDLSLVVNDASLGVTTDNTTPTSQSYLIVNDVALGLTAENVNVVPSGGGSTLYTRSMMGMGI